jgi:phasin family protein
MKDVPMNSFQAAGFPFVNADVTRAWSYLKLPSLKIGELLEVQRKNASALTHANQVVFDGLTTLAQRQGELFKATVNDCSKVTYDVLGGASLAEKATKQADAARHICVSSVAGLQELSDIVMKANVTAVDILNARVSEALDEVRALFAEPIARTTATPVAEPPAIAESATVAEEAPDEDAIAAEPVAVVKEVSETDTVATGEPEQSVSAAPTTAPKKAARSTKAARRPSKR